MEGHLLAFDVISQDLVKEFKFKYITGKTPKLNAIQTLKSNPKQHYRYGVIYFKLAALIVLETGSLCWLLYVVL